MKHEKDIPCASVILAVEYIPDKNSICVSLSNRTFIFFDAASYKLMRKFNLKFIQKCLCYVRRKKVMFSAQTDCTVNSWNIEKIFLNSEFEEDINEKNAEKKDFDYIPYLTDSTPWFITKNSWASCIVDLPNIEHIAIGTYYFMIELWELRNENQ
jgi:hypothetical protein